MTEEICRFICYTSATYTSRAVEELLMASRGVCEASQHAGIMV